MDCSRWSEFPSPESCVTSLLSSSGHLRSSLRPSDQNATFTYKDKQYDSASAALDAYIADFEESGRTAGSLRLPHGPPPTPRKKGGAPRNRDVLRERLTDRELDFLHLPVSSLHHHSNRQRLSMTTDELLSMPNDGSMPVTHTSAFIRGLLTPSGAPQSCCFSPRPSDRTGAGPSGSRAAPHPQSQPSAPPRLHRCRERPEVLSLKAADPSSSSADRAPVPEASSLLHFPHWFTRNKAAMDCSDISSVPDLMYPAWLQLFDGADAPRPSGPEPRLDRAVPSRAVSRTGAPSWVADLEEDDDADHASTQVTTSDSQQLLRRLRLELAEQISALAADRSGSAAVTALHKENKMGSLIDKADRVLTWLSQSAVAAGSSAPLISSDAVSMEDPPPFPLGTAGEACAQVETDGTHQVDDCGSHGNGIQTLPGPVEALKLMLFRLQTVEAELQRRVETTAPPSLCGSPQTPRAQVPEGEARLRGSPGSPSLQRALHHLNHLKLLVEEPRRKKPDPGEEKDKDEDEGRYSSSSADRLISSQQEPL
uniref:Lung adenoma susceptibility protein 2 n=1 Tax=Oryzias latipes TaxID=8090 RepID=A0A3P9I028_ORYLA